MVDQIGGIVIGIIIALIAVMIGMILIKVLQRYKVSDDSIKEVIAEYEETLLEIGQLALDILSEDKSNTTPEEYNKKIMDMTADYFRSFLKRETQIPDFIVNSITGDHMFDIIDYIDTMTKMKLQGLDSEISPNNNKYEIDKVMDPGGIFGVDYSNDTGTVDISKDINHLLDDDNI